VQKRGSSNLSSKFYEAFEIIEKVGKIAYKLNLPKGSQVHLVFHVSHLKEKLGTNMIRDDNGPGRAGFMSNPGPDPPTMLDGTTQPDFINDILLLDFLIKLLHNQLIIFLVNDFSLLNIISLENDYCI
jgi:hypothetical protein